MHSTHEINNAIVENIRTIYIYYLQSNLKAKYVQPILVLGGRLGEPVGGVAGGEGAGGLTGRDGGGDLAVALVEGCGAFNGLSAGAAGGTLG